MNIHFGNQSQFELFPGTTGEPIENSAPSFIFSRVVLTFENLVVIFVFMIVSLIIAFSVGVERGRMKARIARPAGQIAAPAQVMGSVMPNPQISITPVMPQTMVRTAPVMVGTAEAAREVPQRTVAVPASAQTPPREKVVDKGYTVQVASYKKESIAVREAKDLKAKGFDSFVAQKGDYSILCIGRFSQQDEAKQMLNKLKKRYKDSIIRSF
ncbi:MAG: SPOR domain-containing protein [Candidatus Omnitrophica bacterium]|nr:SPOR domain-containing protein [Candidatus Omnitrophota bacterium]